MDTTGKARATCHARYQSEMFFVRDTTLHVVLSREALESREKNSRVRKCQMRVLMRAVSVSCSHHPSLAGESPLPVSDMPLTCKNQFIAHTTLMSVTMKKTATTQTVAILRKKIFVFAECRTTSSLSSGRHAPHLRRAKQMVGLVAIELVLEDEVCGELGQILEKTLTKFLGLLIIFSLIHGSVSS